MTSTVTYTCSTITRYKYIVAVGITVNIQFTLVNNFISSIAVSVYCDALFTTLTAVYAFVLKNSEIRKSGTQDIKTLLSPYYSFKDSLTHHKLPSLITIPNQECTLLIMLLRRIVLYA